MSDTKQAEQNHERAAAFRKWQAAHPKQPAHQPLTPEQRIALVEREQSDRRWWLSA